MVVLGIDTSCDDTSVAVLRDGTEILANIVSTQTDIHRLFGGIVPEIASRRHVELIDAIYGESLRQAGLAGEEIDVIGVTSGPGLIGSLLVGLCFAKGLCLTLEKPLVAVNHVHAHALSILLETTIPFPYLALVVSGGHTMLLRVDGADRLAIIGTTRDDAAGEAFDKAAKFLHIGYPGGQVIEAHAQKGDPGYVRFPRPMLDEQNYDFSFSGLKTAFINYINKNTVTGQNINSILASFQEAVCEVLCQKTVRAARATGLSRIVVGGGVAANGRLRGMLAAMAGGEGMEVYFSSPSHCTDNGAMVALVADRLASLGYSADLDVKAFSRMKITMTC